MATAAASDRWPRFQRNGATTRSPVSRRSGPPGPASRSAARPSGVSTTMASPCPTSRTVIRRWPSGGRMSGHTSMTMAMRPSTDSGDGRRPGVAFAPPRRLHADRPETERRRVGDHRGPVGRGQMDDGARHGGRDPDHAAQRQEHRPHGVEQEVSRRFHARRRGRRPPAPRTVAMPARGTTARLAITPMVETWLKWARAMGSTASWAATLTPSAARSGLRGSGARTIPAVAAKESWKPGSWRSPGRVARMARPARARLLSTEASRSSSRAPRISTPMMAARSTDGSGPTTQANAMTAAMAAAAAVRDPAPRHREQREDRRGEERDVEAGYGEHVIHPGAAEAVVQVARAAPCGRRAGARRGGPPRSGAGPRA